MLAATAGGSVGRRARQRRCGECARTREAKRRGIASRCAGFLKKRFDNRLVEQIPEPDLFQTFVQASSTIAGHYEQREFGRAVREIMALADKANQCEKEMKFQQMVLAAVENKSNPELQAAFQWGQENGAYQ